MKCCHGTTKVHMHKLKNWHCKRTLIQRKWGIMVFAAHAFIAKVQVMISIKIHVFNKIIFGHGYHKWHPQHHNGWSSSLNVHLSSIIHLYYN